MKDFEVQLISKLGVIENKIDNIVEANVRQDEILQNHNKILNGNGRKGLVTNVSNINLQMKIIIWASGAIISSTLWFVIRSIK